MEYNLYELKNGIRVIHQPIKNRVAHCGFIINTGTRDEKIEENGLAHFIEHSIFKGTSNRKAHHILNRIDTVGGEINAYTTKEKTCVYASFTSEYFERATELLSDIIFNSTYPEKEIKKEKDVIIDEIYSYQDNPFEQIYDDFEELVFKNHPLGMNILGTVDTVNSFKRDDIIKFIERNHATNKIIFSIVGDFTEKKVKTIINKYLNQPLKTSSSKARIPFKDYTVFNQELEKENYQAHCMIGNVAYSSKDKNNTGFILLNNILGGPAMNSRLNMGIREKYGFTYNIESSYTSYTDSGLFSIYLGTDTKHLNKSIDLVHKELKNLRTKKLSSSQLQKAKQQLIGQITLSEESKVNVMLGMGKSLLFFNKVDSLETVYAKINKLTTENILEIANEVFDKDKLSSLIYKPVK
ncbi:insulinase family protein [Vicingus serpentipes]|uniref:Insulinase family protein n=1 Tax=Vicingus serpentipes TaxID=1926625 RepID=A0A5C6RS58_9FLAO|nr:pitrilysin family protein [Vicingus serpentipes]TXB65191.1 insulinase family protein [Vicingus serpentipes]